MFYPGSSARVIATLVLGLAVGACQTTRGVPSGMYHNLQDYLAADDFKAMAAARRHADLGWSFAWAWSRPDARRAVEAAMESCVYNNRTNDSNLHECRLQYVGDVNVMSMEAAEIEAVIAGYGASETGDGSTTSDYAYQNTSMPNVWSVGIADVCKRAVRRDDSGFFEWDTESHKAYVDEALRRNWSVEMCVEYVLSS